MSEENVEIVRRIMEAWPKVQAENFSELVTRTMEPECDYYPAPGLPGARPCHGREDVVRFLNEFRAAWEEYRYDLKLVRPVGDDRVLLHGHVRAEGRTSGVTLEADLYQCFWLRHGRFIRVEDHLSEEGAIHAVGLSGETLEAAGLSE